MSETTPTSPNQSRRFTLGPSAEAAAGGVLVVGGIVQIDQHQANTPSEALLSTTLWPSSEHFVVAQDLPGIAALGLGAVLLVHSGLRFFDRR